MPWRELRGGLGELLPQLGLVVGAKLTLLDGAVDDVAAVAVRAVPVTAPAVTTVTSAVTASSRDGGHSET